MANLCEIKIEEGKTNWILWLGFSKLLKMLIGDENVGTFMEDVTLKVSIFFNSMATVAQLAS